MCLVYVWTVTFFTGSFLQGVVDCLLISLCQLIFRSEVVKNVDALLGKVCLVVCLPFLSMLLKLTVT